MGLSTIITLISTLGAVVAIGSAYIGYRKGVKQEGSNEGSLRSDVGYIKAGVDELKTEIKDQRQQHYALAERVVKIDESTKSAHKRIDGLEERIEHFESK